MTLLKVVDYYIGHNKYTRALLMACGLLIVLAGIGFGYRWYRSSYNQRAHAALAEAIELFDRANKDSTTSLWDETDRALAQGYSDYSGSSLAPYFLAFQAQVALQKIPENVEKARELLQKALKNMSADMPFYGIYVIQLARMKSDSGIQDLEDEGIKTLQDVANNQKSSERGMALYYLGLRPFEAGDREQAIMMWTPLFKEADLANSFWSQIAQAKLDYQA